MVKFLIILILIAGLGAEFYFFRPQALSVWNSLTDKAGEYLAFLAPNPEPVVMTTPTDNTVNTVVAPVSLPTVNKPTTDCGVGTAPKLGATPSSVSGSVLSCLGASAASCDNAKGVLQDNIFPTLFEISKTSTSCNFKLSYAASSTLKDPSGNPLALQYIMCPVDIVKTIDNTNPATPKFIAPNKTNLTKYGSDIYLYGTLGVFVENNLDVNKIRALGCSGDYIQSMIASYNAKK